MMATLIEQILQGLTGGNGGNILQGLNAAFQNRIGPQAGAKVPAGIFGAGGDKFSGLPGFDPAVRDAALSRLTKSRAGGNGRLQDLFSALLSGTGDALLAEEPEAPPPPDFVNPVSGSAGSPPPLPDVNSALGAQPSLPPQLNIGGGQQQQILDFLRSLGIGGLSP